MKSNNEHPKFLELSMYVDGELDQERKRAVEQHIQECRRCSELLEDIRRNDEDVLTFLRTRRDRFLTVDEEAMEDALRPKSSVCRNEKLMFRYLDGSLSRRKRNRYERHLEECAYCRRRLKFVYEADRMEELPELGIDEEASVQQIVDGLLRNPPVRSYSAGYRSFLRWLRRLFDRFSFDRYRFPELIKGTAGRAALPIILFLSLSSVIFVPLFYWLMSYFRYFNRTVLIMYAVFTPFIGVVFRSKAIFETISEFLSGRERDRKRMNSIILMFYITLVIALNAPLLESVYTGMDMYGFFRFRLYEGETAEMALIRGIMFSMLLNIVIATFSTVVLYVIHRIYLRRFGFEEEIPYISSTFAMVVIPAVLAYVPVALFARRTVDVFIVELLLPIVVAFLACVGFSHPKNKLDLFQSKVLIFVCIAGIFIGVLAAAGLAALHLTNVIRLETPDVWRSHVSQFRIDWEGNALGYPRDDYMSRWRNGFAWMVSLVAIYIVAGLGFFTTMTIMRYQYNYAAGKIKD